MYFHLLKKPQFHKRLTLIGANAFVTYSGSILYAILPVLYAAKYNEWIAGLIVGGFNLIQALFLNPTFGNLSDRYGSRRIMMISSLSGSIAAITWLLIPFLHTSVLFISTFFIFGGYTLRSVSETYLLRSSKKDEGGFIFGLSEDIYALSYFLVTMSIPFFLVTEHQYYAGIILLFCSLLSYLFISRIPKDIQENKIQKPLKNIFLFNPFDAIKLGMHFIKKNNSAPVPSIVIAFFESIFYGTIWFVFPLHLMQLGSESFKDGLILGIYEVVTIFAAAYIGYLADKHDWTKIFILGWSFIAIGVLALPFFDWPIWLVIVGLIIAFGDNMAAFSGLHLLEATDKDHAEDGAFIAFKYLFSDIGYAISPIIAGFLYYSYGFRIGLVFASLVGLVAGIIMIWFVLKKKYLPHLEKSQ
jgi:MFS family permease